MRYIEAPEIDYSQGNLIYLAGGVTGCPDWQAEAVSLLQDSPHTVLNPRRQFFPAGDRVAMTKQVEWEYRNLRRASAILFWFPSESIQPIVWYELGGALAIDKPVSIGADPGYVRRLDLELQLGATRPGARVHDTLYATVQYALELLDAASRGSSR